MTDIGLFWRTVRHLTGRQLLYQVIVRLRSRAKLRMPNHVPAAYFLAVPTADKPISYKNGWFTCLNQSVSFGQATDSVDWNYAANDKLWTYTLNYFDFLNQPGITAETGLQLIRSFIGQTNTVQDGLEPYPTSLRSLNWVQFLSRHQLYDQSVNAHLFAQFDLLGRRLEYQLGGNHLLENGFALLTGALYFRHRGWFRKASSLLRAELTTQIGVDGGHDERSPMYHQLLLDRLLDVGLALRHDTWHNNPDLLDFLGETVHRMLSWLISITFRNGDVPMVNDAAPGVGPTTAQIRTKAANVGPWCGRPILMSDYRMFRARRYELFVDVGPVGSEQQPGHAHADTLSFVLYVDNCPLFVDTGTSTYQVGPRRNWERSTAAHNTVGVNGQNSSEVWAGFRVGRRAKTTIKTDTDTTLTASHDGYQHLGIIHERTWSIAPAKLCVSDRLLSANRASGVARFYVHPTLPLTLTGSDVLAGPVRMSFESEMPTDVRVVSCELACGFNRLQPGQCLEVTFTKALKTILTLKE